MRTAQEAGDQKRRKLARGRRLRRLLDDGFNPIVFCRFIPTAEYVADGAAPGAAQDVEVTSRR